MRVLGTVVFATTASAFVPVAPPGSSTPRTIESSFLGARRHLNTVAPASTLDDPATVAYSPIFDFATAPETAVSYWERIDDVVMGGVSSSAVRTAPGGGATWSGIVRTAGGGFCGARTAPLATPLDLSKWRGIYVDAALASDDDAARRAWKLTLRASADRGEVVYNAEFEPPAASSSDTNKKILVPFTSFRLVRGPRAVAGARPLDPKALRHIFGLGLTVSKFGPPAANGSSTLVDDFRDGFFSLALREIGCYGAVTNAPVALPDLVHPRDPATTSSTTKRPPNSLPRAAPTVRQNPVAALLLRPLSQFVFAEAPRRRRRARELLVERGKTQWPRLYGQRVIKRGIKGMTPWAARAEGLTQLSRDALAGALAIPLRLLFRTIFAAVRLRRRLQGLLKNTGSSSAQGGAVPAS